MILTFAFFEYRLLFDYCFKMLSVYYLPIAGSEIFIKTEGGFNNSEDVASNG